MTQWLLIGLGNPGVQYDGTRHNLGIDALRAWVGDDIAWKVKTKMNAEIATVSWHSAVVSCFFPLTGMNDSGQAVVAFLKNNPIEPENILILHDELELPLGEVRYVAGGSAKGHNGVRSLHQYIGTDDIPRLKIGIGRPLVGTTVHDFVIGRFTPEQQTIVSSAIAQVSNQIVTWLPA